MHLLTTKLIQKLAIVFTILSLGLSAYSNESSLIRTNAVVMKLKGANLILEGALKKAKEMKLAVNITVVDAGGHLLAFSRMDDARPASIYTSHSKAATAALKLGDTGALGHTKEVDTHLNLAVENAAMMSGGKFTTLKGGIAIVVNGKVIGGIGVGGAKGNEDAEIAKAGLDVFLKALKDENK